VPHQPIIFFHFKLIAKVSAAVSMLAILVLMATLVTISGESGGTYGEIIRGRSLTREHLGVAMLVAGLLLVAVTGVITSLIVFYSSFRVAGPLYRFSQNLKLARSGDFSPPQGLRKGDALSRQAAAIEQAIGAVREHYGALEEARSSAMAALDCDDAEGYAAALARLRELDAKVGL
jgi:hypothetical protein